MSSPERLSAGLLDQALRGRELVDRRGQGRAEAFFVRAALVRVDRVGERVDRLDEAVVPLHRDLQRQALGLVLGLDRDDLAVDRRLAADVDVLDVVDQALVVAEPGVALDRVDRGVALGGLLGLFAVVAEHELEALVEERHLAEAGLERLVAVDDALEDVLAGVERRRGAGLVGLLVPLERSIGHAVGERLGPAVAVALDLDVELGRQRVDDRDADAVQATGDLVAAAAELAAGVQRGEDQRDGRDLLGGVLVDRDAAAVIDDPDAAIGLQGDRDVGGVARERFVDRVVDDLVDEVVESAFTGRADVHAGALANRLQTFEDLNVAGVVRSFRIWSLAHLSSIRAVLCVSALTHSSRAARRDRQLPLRATERRL